MKTIIYSNVSETALAEIFGVGTETVRAWVAEGLPRNANGTFTICRSCRWINAQYKAELRKIKSCNLEQQQLADLFGVVRQTVAIWGRNGLPRNKNKTYDLKKVCRFLRGFYQKQGEAKYEKRLMAMRKKVTRNAAQLQRFLAGDKTKLSKLFKE